MKNLAVLLSMLCIFLYSCKEQEDQPLQPGAAATEYFYPMKTGNYWVYEVITDLMGGSNQDTIIDTVRIVGKLVGGEKMALNLFGYDKNSKKTSVMRS